MKNIVLYHANCADGFGAAYAAWRVLGDDARYLPVRYGDPLPDEVASADLGDTEVFILDFSYPRAELEALHARCRDLVVIDHHASAQRELKGLDFAVFDRARSAAVLAWLYFQEEAPVPELLSYVQDRDLWAWVLPDSREISEAIDAYLPRRFVSWRDCVQTWGLMKKEMVKFGQAALRKSEGLVDRACGGRRWMSVDGHRVTSVCSCLLQSEIGHALLQLEPAADFAAIYTVDPDGELRVSLRGRGDFDLSEIAKKFGGGGHRDAAGFRWPTGLVNAGVPAAALEEHQLQEVAS